MHSRARLSRNGRRPGAWAPPALALAALCLGALRSAAGGTLSAFLWPGPRPSVPPRRSRSGMIAASVDDVLRRPDVALAAAKKAAAKSGGKAISDGDTIWIKTHNGNYLNADSNTDDVKARAPIKADRATWIIEAGGKEIKPGDTVHLRGYKGGYVDVQGDMVRMRFQDKTRCSGLTIAKDGSGPICEGDPVFFKGGDRGTYIDVENQDVRARWPDEGKWQVMYIEH